MKKQRMFILVTSICAFMFNSCDTEGEYEVDDTLVPVGAGIIYMKNQEARYRIDFGNTKIADSLPFLKPQDSGKPVLTRGVSGIYLKQRELTQDLKVWRLNKSGTEVLESSRKFNATNGITFLQLTDNLPLALYNPILPPADKTKQINVQFFYKDNAQSDNVMITILAIDYYYYLTNGRNLATMPADRKTEVTSFTLKKGDLSDVINFDLKLFKNSPVATVFFYKTTDMKTGAVLQDYKANPADVSTIIPIQKKLGGVDPKYKSSVLELGYISETVPFKVNETPFINGEEWK